MSCLKLIINAGIDRLVYKEGYNMENKVKEELVKESNLIIENFNKRTVLVYKINFSDVLKKIMKFQLINFQIREIEIHCNGMKKEYNVRANDLLIELMSHIDC